MRSRATKGQRGHLRYPCLPADSVTRLQTPAASCLDPLLWRHLLFSPYSAGETFSPQWAMQTEGADTRRGMGSLKHRGAQTHRHIVRNYMLLIMFLSVSFSAHALKGEVTKQHNSKSSLCLFVLSLWCPLENGANMQGKLWDTLLLILGGMSPSSRLLNVSF